MNENANLPPWRSRIVDEKSDLDEKLRRLNAFLDTPTYLALSIDEQSRLRLQRHHMSQYSLVLGRRLETS